MKTLGFAPLSILAVIVCVGCAHQSTTESTAAAGKAVVTTETTTSETMLPQANPNPTPYSGLPAFVGTRIAPGQ